MVAQLSPQALALAGMRLRTLRDADPWRRTARPNQLPPDGEWRTWFIQAGRGFGKTRTAAEWTRDEIMFHGKRRFALVGATAADVRDVMVEGESGLLACCERYGVHAEYQPSRRRVLFPNGAKAIMYSADEPNRLRGPQHDCFVAGTMIATPYGERPIETIAIGDLVLTRFGSRRVIDARQKPADVGIVAFSNGAKLTGTAQHPVLNLHGWTNLSELKRGDWVCAGERLRTATSQPTWMAARSINTDGFGSSTEGRFRAAFRFITKTKTLETTTSTILSWLSRSRTKLFTPRLTSEKWSLASIAATSFSGAFGNVSSQSSALAANIGARKKIEKGSAFAVNAAPFSSAAKATIAVSVASTWEPVGRATVYNLSVDEHSEYIANGIVVHNCAWGDEIAAWRRPEAYENLDMGLRLGDDPRMVLTGTPKPVTLVRSLVKRAQEPNSDVVVTRGALLDNSANLAPGFVAGMKARYAGTRIGRQELDGELLEDVEGALWTLGMIDAARVEAVPDGVHLVEVAVAIDPAASSGETSAETGIVVVARGSDGDGYVLDDCSLRGTPHEWGSAAVRAFDQWSADHVTPEANNGGEMVTSTLQTVRPTLPIRPVHASRGKATRAEPVSALYEQGRIHHVGVFPALEDQMAMWVPGMPSPDRMDALVWGVTDVILGQDDDWSDVAHYVDVGAFFRGGR